MDKVATILGIYRGEERMTLLSLAIYFCQGFAGIFLVSSSMALFLSEFKAEDLSYVYILAAFGVMGTGLAFSALERRMSLLRLAASSFLFLLVSLLGGRLAITLGGGRWAYLFLVAWSIVFNALTQIAVWGLCTRLFDVRQAKRLFGLINSGETMAQVVAGLLTPSLAAFLGTANLLFFSAGGVGLSLVFTLILSRSFGHLLAPVEEGPSTSTGSGQLSLLHEKYPLLLHLLMTLSVMCFFLIEVAFNSQAEYRYATPEALAGFFGLFYALGSTMLLVVNTLAAGRFINRFGTLVSQFVLPVGLWILCLVTAISTFWLPEFGSTVFLLVLGLKMTDYAFRFSIHETSFLVLYQPLSMRKRLLAQTSVQSLARPAATVSVGGLLLLLGAFDIKLDVMAITIFMMVVVTGWLALDLVLRREYPRVLLEALRTRRFGLTDSTFNSETGLNMLRDRLQSPHPGEVIYAMELLEKNFPSQLKDLLPALLAHAEEQVRADAMSRLERLRSSAARQVVHRIIFNPQESVSIRAKAIVTFASIDETDAILDLAELMDHEEPAIMRSALVGLLRYGGIEGIMLAGEKLMRILSSLQDEDRESAARIMGEVGIYSFYRPLGPLLNDRSLTVRRAAISSAEILGNPCLVPHLIDNFGVPELRGSVVRALAAIGEPSIPELIKAFGSPEQPQEIRIHIVKAVALIPGLSSQYFLTENLSYPEVGIRRHILVALVQRNFSASLPEEKELVRSLIKSESETATWLLKCRITAQKSRFLELLDKALDDELFRLNERILALLSFIFPSNSIKEARRNLRQPSRGQQAYAFEMLDVLIEDDLKKIIFPLLDELPATKKLSHLAAHFPMEDFSESEMLLAILERNNAWIGPWTQTAAVYAMGLFPRPEYAPPIRRALESQVPWLAETCAWALECIRTKAEPSARSVKS